MARLPRLDLPGIPQHIVQRGNNRLPCFLDDGDRLRYLQLLREALLATRVRLHAYVLMDNHVHLLATPAAIGDIASLMQKLGRAYEGLFNARHGRTGTLWEGRYKACLVDSDQYVLACQRYIELNPVRARMTEDPAAYAWSSCAAHLGQRPHSLLTPHASWTALGDDAPARAMAWRAVLDEAISDDELAAIRIYLQQQRAWGRDASGRWSKQRPGGLQASGPRTDHQNQRLVRAPLRQSAVQTGVCEPDPVLSVPDTICLRLLRSLRRRWAIQTGVCEPDPVLSKEERQSLGLIDVRV